MNTPFLPATTSPTAADHAVGATLPPGRRRRGRLPRAVLGAALAAAVGIPVGTASTTLDQQVASATETIFPEYEMVAGADEEHSPDIPDCNSANIEHQNNHPTYWRVKSELGPGSTVHVGHEWNVSASIQAFKWGFGTGMTGNDGPDPLNILLLPDGPVAPAGAPTGVQATSSYYHSGGGHVGPIGPYGPYGYAFDVNSSPSVGEAGDGTFSETTVRLKATAPGVVELNGMRVNGYDATPPAGNIFCTLPLDWTWNVIATPGPVGTSDKALTDASYDLGTVDDANHGSHAVDIDVLANDDDPNLANLPKTDQVRIHDWQPKSAHGGDVTCGTDFQKGNDGSFFLLSGGKCRYTPPAGYAGKDSFGYVVKQRTDGKTKYVLVDVDVRANNAPFPSPGWFAAAQDQDKSFDLDPFIHDAVGDTASCLPGLMKDPSSGNVLMHDDCTFDFQSTDPFFDGDLTFEYMACDNHPLLVAHGVGVSKAPGYADGDLDGDTSRRCAQGKALIKVSAGVQLPPWGMKDVADVDAGYASDGIGPYTISVPVMENDVDPNGPTPTEGLAILDGPTADQGTAVVEGDAITFTPADGYAGPVAIEYRVCDDPAVQNPPHDGFGLCGGGLLAIDVLANAAPVTTADEEHMASSEVLEAGDLVVSENDSEPDDEALTCTTGATKVSAPEKVTSVALTPQCDLLLDPVDGAAGNVVIGYEVCDDHHLTGSAFPADPYGADGRSAGDLARRCSEGEVTIHFTPLVGDDDIVADPWDGDPAPICADDAAKTDEQVAVDIDVVANDSDLDEQGDPSDLTLVGAPADDPDATAKGGTVHLDANGTSLVYTPAAGFSGVDTFTYGVKDAHGKGCGADVTVEVADTVVADPDPIDPDPTDPTVPDTGGPLVGLPDVDGDGIPNDQDPDVDGDGIPNAQDPDHDGGGAPIVSGNLPLTGSTTLPLVGAGAGLVLMGAALTAASRRGRSGNG